MFFMGCSETEEGVTEVTLDEEEAAPAEPEPEVANLPDELPVEAVPDEKEAAPAEPVPEVADLPVEQVPDEEDAVQDDPEPEVIDPPLDEAREKAIAAMQRMRERRIERIRADFANPDPDADWNEIHAKIREEETGISDDVMDMLLAIHYEENPEDLEKHNIRFEDLIVEYLHLSFQHPEKNEEELLDLFREAARNGETTICINVVAAIYGIK